MPKRILPANSHVGGVTETSPDWALHLRVDNRFAELAG